MENTMNDYETGSSNKTYKKVLVPSAAEIKAMPDKDLLQLRADLTDAKLAIESQISIAAATDNKDLDWIVRTNGALSHMRRGLALIKTERERRSMVTKIPQDLTPAFQAIDQLRDVLKAHAALVTAVRNFLEDDNDNNFDALEQLVDPQ
jgi:hypothetical protein